MSAWQAAAGRTLVEAVVVTYNSASFIGPALDALVADPSGPAWITVVDNASTDRTAAEVAARSGVALVPMGRNAGYAAALNAAMRRSPERDHLILNPDVRLDPGATAALAAAAQATGVGISAPRLVDGRGRCLPTLRRDPSILRALGEALLGGERAGRFPTLGEMVTAPEEYVAPHDVDWASGAALYITAACSARVGPWDESFFLYSEETDFALRTRDAGLRIRFAPDAHGVHHGGDAHVDPRLWAILTVNRVRLYERRHRAAATVAFRAAVTLNEAMRALGGRSAHRVALRALWRPSQRPVEIRGAA